nr:MAG TPA: hypothetical protein [Caudoviricetes sp.]DAO15971.1 MAG TPA: hypothetical protein [Caudoviricetes sp.]
MHLRRQKLLWRQLAQMSARGFDRWSLNTTGTWISLWQ